MSDNNTSNSIMLRVRRTTYEDAYVAVPVTDKVMETKEDGTFGINFDAFVSEAIRISNNQQVEWQIESSQTEPHHLQTPKPERRQLFDAFYHENNT